MKVEADKLDINELVNELVPSGLNELKTKVGDLKKLSNVVTKKVEKKTVYKKLNRKVNNLENKIPNANEV